MSERPGLIASATDLAKSVVSTMPPVALFVLTSAAGLITLHGMDGQVIYVNPDQVTNLRKPRSTDQGHFAKGINCLVFQADGKYFATLESCEDVRKRLQQ